MPLTCGCSDNYDECYYYGDFKPLPTKKAKRCLSCKTLIKPGETVLDFSHYKLTVEDSIEERIHGTEKQLADKYHCEECGELFSAFEELGYCVSPEENMKSLLEEYKRIKEE